MLVKHIALAASLSMLLIDSSAAACKPAPRPPELPGESSKAYAARLRQLDLEQMRLRVEAGLQSAETVFIARDYVWQPPARPLPVRPKVRSSVRRPAAPLVNRPHWKPVPPPPPLNDRTGIGGSSYVAPIDWFRGTRSFPPFAIERAYSFCGPMSFGDTDHSQPGDLYLFFAKKGPVSEATLIDAIALDSIDHPALNAFVAKHRKAPAPPR